MLAAFLQSAFSQSGYAKLKQIRALESVLAMQACGQSSTPNRDPENYFVQFHGTPVVDGDLPWASASKATISQTRQPSSTAVFSRARLRSGAQVPTSRLCRPR